MVKEIDQICCILQSVLPTYKITKNFENNAPSLSVQNYDVGNTPYNKERTFKIRVRATSTENLESAISTLLKLFSDNPTYGYNFGNADYIQIAPDETHGIDQEAEVYGSEYVGDVGIRDAPEPKKNTYNLFAWDFEYDIPVSALYFIMTPSQTNLSIFEFQFFTDKNVYSISDYTSFVTAKAILEVLTSDDLNVNVFTDNIDKTATLTNGLTTIGSTFNHLTVFLRPNSDDPGDINIFKKFDAYVMKAVLTKTGFPIYIEMKYLNHPEDLEDIFEADVLLLARWSNV